MARPSAAQDWQQAIIVIAAAVVAVVLIAALHWAQIIFIPLALGIFLTFLLNPIIRVLERGGLRRVPAVVLVVVLAGCVLSGLLWMVTDQVTTLVAELPTYTENIKGKVRQIRKMGGRTQLTERLGTMQREIAEELNSDSEPKSSQTGEAKDVAVKTAETPPATAANPLTEAPAWLAGIVAVIVPALTSIGTVALAVLLAIFMLLQREDLRNRFIRLVGQGRVAGTTKAVDDAAERISRYLLMQLIVNGTYGLAWGVGLFFIGVDHALLWGFLAAVLRYVPYIGAPIAAILPVALSLVQFPGWWQPLAVLGFLIVLELVSNNLMEPWLYGTSIGVSVVATVISAVFWGFLWGPIGLVLASPLTVCLVVLGKYVPQLAFIDVLLGDEPVLEPHFSFYQRLLARDQDEAAQLVLNHVKEGPLETVYDALLIPALNFARRDRQRDEVTDLDEEFIHRATREILADLGEKRSAALFSGDETSPSRGEETSLQPPIHLLAIPAQDEADRLALSMLVQLLDARKWQVEIMGSEMLTSELVAAVGEKRPALICIASLPPGGLAHTRYLCKRLRAPFPAVKIIVGRWGLRGNLESNREQLDEAGGDQMAVTLLEARDQLEAWRPTLASVTPRAAAG